MQSFFSLLKFSDVKQKVFFTLALVFIYRIGSHIPISGLDMYALQKMFSSGGVLGFFNLFSGGGLSRFSIFGLGILPYINASIIMQLATIIWPKLKEIAEEGESGRKQLAQYTRYLAIGIAVVQSVVMGFGFRGFLAADMSFSLFIFLTVVGLVAGAAFVMWMSELISEFGIGNGASVIIFVGIVAQMPVYFKNTYIQIQGGASVFGVVALFLVFAVIILGIILIQEAQRKIPIQYAKRVVGRKMLSAQSTYIPLKLIQGGVMPIIFSSAMLQFPLMFAQYFNVKFLVSALSYDGFLYNFLFCIFIFFFAYFYTAVTFNPQELSDNLKKHGGFVMGIRPGKQTVLYFDKIVSKLTFVGAAFLSLIALLPIITSNLTSITSFMGLGGTALLIIVGVSIDIIKQIQSIIVTKKYEGLV